MVFTCIRAFVCNMTLSCVMVLTCFMMFTKGTRDDVQQGWRAPSRPEGQSARNQSQAPPGPHPPDFQSVIIFWIPLDYSSWSNHDLPFCSSSARWLWSNTARCQSPEEELYFLNLCLHCNPPYLGICTCALLWVLALVFVAGRWLHMTPVVAESDKSRFCLRP